VLSVLALVPELMRKAASWSAIVAQRKAPGVYHAMRTRCWERWRERSSRRNHVMLDGLRAAGRGAAGLSGGLFNGLWTAVLDVCQRLWWFSLVDAVDATFDEGPASWASVGCGAGLYKRTKSQPERVVTSKGWDRSSPRAGLAGLNTFALLALGGVRSEGVGGGSGWMYTSTSRIAESRAARWEKADRHAMSPNFGPTVFLLF
jgi:hypothetical protein